MDKQRLHGNFLLALFLVGGVDCREGWPASAEAQLRRGKTFLKLALFLALCWVGKNAKARDGFPVAGLTPT
jgi:hypothetical protein